MAAWPRTYKCRFAHAENDFRPFSAESAASRVESIGKCAWDHWEPVGSTRKVAGGMIEAVQGVLVWYVDMCICGLHQTAQDGRLRNAFGEARKCVF